MKRRLLHIAKVSGFEITQDSTKKHKINNLRINGNQWDLKEKETNEWLVSINGVPNAILNNEAVIKVLKIATKG